MRWIVILAVLLSGCGRETSRSNCISCEGKLTCSKVDKVVCPLKVDVARQI